MSGQLPAPRSPDRPSTVATDPRPYPRWLDRGAGVAGRFLLIVAAVAVVVWMALQVKVVAAAAVLGFAVTSVLWPLARWLRGYRVPAVLAALVSVALFLGVFALITFVVLDQVLASVPDLVAAVSSLVDATVAWVSRSRLGEDSAVLQNLLTEVQSWLGTGLARLSGGVVTGLAAVGNLATVFAITVVFAIFALTSGDELWRQFVGLLPRETREPANASMRAVMRTAGGWFFASTLTGLVDGLLIGAGLLVLGVPLAVPIGALTFILGYVPLIGATVAGAVAVAVALLSGGWVDGLWALLIVLAVQQIEGNVLSPLLLSRAVSFPPLVTLLLTTAAGVAFGIVGVFLAVPVVGSVVAGAVAYHQGTVSRRPGPAPGPPAASAR